MKESEIFGRLTINLLDDLEIDVDTHEYRINGGSWINALTADDGGVEVRFPTLVRLTNEEFGSLASIPKFWLMPPVWSMPGQVRTNRHKQLPTFGVSLAPGCARPSIQLALRVY